MTGSSPLFTEVVAFGRRLVDELKLDESADTPGRWMAHYLAEVMLRAEAARGAKKVAAKRECFDIILQLWKHRASLPGSGRPMESFATIFQALARLLDHQHLVYFSHTEHPLDPSSKIWLELASSIDHAARDLIRWCLAMASLEAAKKDGSWVKCDVARALDDGPDLQAARMLLQNAEIFIGTDEELAQERTNELSRMRQRLEALISMSDRMRRQIDKALGVRIKNRRTARRRTGRRQ